MCVIRVAQILLVGQESSCFVVCWWELRMVGFSWVHSTALTSKETSFYRMQQSIEAQDDPLLLPWNSDALASFSSLPLAEPLAMSIARLKNNCQWYNFRNRNQIQRQIFYFLKRGRDYAYPDLIVLLFVSWKTVIVSITLEMFVLDKLDGWHDE